MRYVTKRKSEAHCEHCGSEIHTGEPCYSQVRSLTGWYCGECGPLHPDVLPVSTPHEKMVEHELVKMLEEYEALTKKIVRAMELIEERQEGKRALRDRKTLGAMMHHIEGGYIDGLTFALNTLREVL